MRATASAGRRICRPTDSTAGRSSVHRTGAWVSIMHMRSRIHSIEILNEK
jgi:hypothetical protein